MKSPFPLVHGSGADRHDARNRLVAASLVRAGFGTLLVGLLDEAATHERHDVFDVELQAERLARAPQGVRAVVCRGGRPDTALYWLPHLRIPGAGDSFREPGAIEAVAEHACRWFARHLGALEAAL